MATESELALLEGAAASPVSFESILPEQLCSPSPLCYDLIRSRQVCVILAIESRCFRIYVPDADGSTGAEFGRDGQAGATAETEAPLLRGATVACLCDDCTEV